MYTYKSHQMPFYQVMRNIFQVCFNTYKSEEESRITDTCALRYLRFSRKLFEVIMWERQEIVTYLVGEDFLAHVIAIRSGHRSNVEFAKLLRQKIRSDLCVEVGA